MIAQPIRAGLDVRVRAFDHRSKTRIAEHGETWTAASGVEVPPCLNMPAVLITSKSRCGYQKWWPASHLSIATTTI
jgi:hypothetical protein